MKVTREEFFYMYGDEKVKFTSYYKYSFYFGNDRLKVIVGGAGPDEIYRTSVEADKEYTLKELNPTWGEVKANGVSVHEFNEEYW